MMRIRLRCDRFYLSDGDDGQKSDKQKEEREEQSKRSDIGQNIDPCRGVCPPARRKEIAMQAHHDYEPFEPHADVDENRENPNEPECSPAPTNPEQLRRDHVARDHDPISPTVRAEGAI